MYSKMDCSILRFVTADREIYIDPVSIVESRGSSQDEIRDTMMVPPPLFLHRYAPTWNTHVRHIYYPVHLHYLGIYWPFRLSCKKTPTGTNCQEVRWAPSVVEEVFLLNHSQNDRRNWTDLTFAAFKTGGSTQGCLRNVLLVQTPPGLRYPFFLVPLYT